MLPSCSSDDWPPLPSSGSRRVGSPPSSVLRATPTPALPSDWLLVIAWPYPLSACGSLPVPSGTTAPNRELSGQVAPAPDFSPFGGERRASQVPGKPLCEHALLSDTGGSFPPSHFSGSVLPSTSGRMSAATIPTFRCSITRSAHSLSTLHSAGCPMLRKTRYRLAATLGRVGLAPTGFQFAV